MKKSSAFIFTLLLSLNVFAQGPKLSKLMKECVSYGAKSYLTVDSKNLKCTQPNILWLEGIEDQADKTKLVHEKADMINVNQMFGKINAGKIALTIDHRKMSKIEDLQDDSKTSGTDISIDTFIISQTRAKVIQKDANGNMVPANYSDTESEFNRQDETGADVMENSNHYGFYPLVMFDIADPETKTQTILPGTSICSKPKRKFGSTWGVKKRTYVESNTPAQYCYGNTLGINLPAGFKSAESALGIKLILPYSQTGPKGQEDDLVAKWPSITKKQYDDAQYILLTSGKIKSGAETTEYPRIVIGLTKKPVKITD